MTSSLESNGQKVSNPTLINMALRQMVAMLQHQVGARYPQYSFVLVRRLFFDKDYIVAAVIISLPRPILYSIAAKTTFALAGRFILTTNKIRVKKCSTFLNDFNDFKLVA